MNYNNNYILLVEDDKAIQESLVWVLEAEGYAVKVANNGYEGLSYIKENLLPRMIILDLMMPVMSGFEFREIQQSIPAMKEIPTVIMSANHQLEKSIEKYSNEGTLKKPIDLDKLLDMITACLA